MTKTQIIEAVTKQSRLDRNEVLKVIVNSNISEDYLISSEQQAELTDRLDDLSTNKINLSEGKVVMKNLAKKYDI